MSVIRKNLLNRLPIILMAMLLALAIAPAIVSAEDPPAENPPVAVDDDMSNDEESTFKSPNDVKNLEQKTANILDAVAKEVSDLEDERVAKQSKLDDAEDDLDAKKDALDEATDDVKEKAEQDVADAEAAVEEAQQALDDLDERLGDLAGVDADTVRQLRREDGLGYGQICHKLGIHPSALGNKYGHMNTHQNKHQFGKKGDMSAATARDLKTGWAKGHGKSVSGKSNGKGKADSFGVDNSGKAKGKSNGNSGGGKGGGKGGGNGKK